jgi:hypothetical protein
VGDLINNYANSTAGAAIQSALSGFNGRLLGPTVSVNPQAAVFGFASAIQSGTYMVGGIDVGMYIKNNLLGLLTGSAVNIYMPAPNKYFPAGTYKTPGPASTSAPQFIITMADGSSTVTFGVIATGNYTWEVAGN